MIVSSIITYKSKQATKIRWKTNYSKINNDTVSRWKENFLQLEFFPILFTGFLSCDKNRH